MKRFALLIFALSACGSDGVSEQEQETLRVQCDIVRTKLNAKRANTEDGLMRPPINLGGESAADFEIRKELMEAINTEIKALQAAVARCEANGRYE